MIILKLKRTKISTGLTVLSSMAENPTSQASRLRLWAGYVPKMIVVGDVPPPPAFGVRWVRTPADATLRNLLGTYMVSVPGSEICLLAAPNFNLGGNREALFKFVDDNSMEMAWGCYSVHPDKPEEGPKLFVFSAPVLAHIIQDLPVNLKLTENWEKWVDEWMKRMMGHRYFDASEYGLIIPEPKEEFEIERPALPKPVLVMEEPIADEIPAKKKRGRPRKSTK